MRRTAAAEGVALIVLLLLPLSVLASEEDGISAGLDPDYEIHKGILAEADMIAEERRQIEEHEVQRRHAREGSMRCEALSDQLATARHAEPLEYTGSNMVYFLHVPRTAGRTLHACFLKKGTPPGRRCPKAYDHLRINVSVPDCFLLSSHDDFSVVSILNSDVSVLTHLRDPVDRFISAYEFATEVAAKMLGKPKGRLQEPKASDRQSIENIWPWSYLVPFFQQDMLRRQASLRQQDLAMRAGHAAGNEAKEDGDRPGAAARSRMDYGWIHIEHPDGDRYFYNRGLGISKWELTAEESARLLPELDPYNNPLVMSLEEFVEDPIAQELLHNGQALQVLGLTNYSHFDHAAEMRGCIFSHGATQAHMLAWASKRLKRFMHVGTTKRLSESVEAAGAALGFSVKGPAYGQDLEADSSDEALGSSPDPKGEEALVAISKSVRRAREGLTELLKQLSAATAAEAEALAGSGSNSNGESGSGGEASSEYEARGARHPSAAVLSLQQRVQAARHQLKNAQEEMGRARAGATPEALQRSMQAEAGMEGAAVSAPSTVGRGAAPERVLGSSLGIEYLQCARRAQKRSSDRREASLLNLAMPDGRWIHFSKAARSGLPASLLERIRELNTMDLSLYQQADRMLDESRSRYQAEGKLQELPPEPKEVPGRGGRGGGGRGGRELGFPIPKPKERVVEDELR